MIIFEKLFSSLILIHTRSPPPPSPPRHNLAYSAFTSAHIPFPAPVYTSGLISLPPLTHFLLPSRLLHRPATDLKFARLEYLEDECCPSPSPQGCRSAFPTACDVRGYHVRHFPLRDFCRCVTIEQGAGGGSGATANGLQRRLAESQGLSNADLCLLHGDRTRFAGGCRRS